MKNRKLLLICLIIGALLALAGCFSQPSNPYAKAEQGIMDLTQLEFENDIAQLDGEWEFYWNQLLTPNEIDKGQLTGFLPVPGSWNKYNTQEGTLSGDGYATYRLTFLTDRNDHLALKLPRFHTAYKLWVNGELKTTAGTVGKNRDTMTPQYLPQIASFQAQQGNNEIVIQVSNFHHRSGGVLESIHLSNEQQIVAMRNKSVAYNILVFGCLVILGAYHLALFFFRKKNTSALYFGSFCIAIGIRTLLVGEVYFIYLFPEFSWEIAHKLMTITYYLGVPLIMMFFQSVFPAYFNDRMIKATQGMGAAFGLVVIFTPARIFSMVNPLYQIWTIIVILYLFGALIRIAVHKEKDSYFLIIGATAFLLATINDIVFHSIWMNDGASSIVRALLGRGNLSSAGLLIFAFGNSLLLAKRFSDAMDLEEKMIIELTEINKNLDAIVLERTEELVDSNKKIEQQKRALEGANRQLQQLSLRDPLTKLWNRRKYDDAIDLEWKRGLRYERPFALMLLDIDYFKEYNDAYGHLAGDECLIRVGQAIQNSLNRATDLVARYGGEEFIMVLPETEKDEAVKLAEIVRQEIEELQIPHAHSAASSVVTVSIGVTVMVPNLNSSHEDLVEVADKALYQAKAAGRNQIKFLSE